MAENLRIALEITLVGMGLVFAAILLLWGLMAALTRLTADGATGETEAEPLEAQTVPALPEQPARDHEHEHDREHDLRRRAAALGVAIALAQQTQSRPPDGAPGKFPLPATALVSAWQAVMRANQINRRGPRR